MMRKDNLYVDNEISGFKKRYLIYLGVLVVLVFGTLITLWVKMSSYQKKVDEELTKEVNEENADISFDEIERAAQETFTDYVDSLDMEGWMEMYYQSHPDRFDSPEDVQTLISERIFNSNTERYKASDYSIDEPKYLIVSDGQALAEVTLSGNELTWNVSGTKMFVGGNESAIVTAPSDCMVRINGAELREEFAQVEKAAVSVDGYDDALTNPVIMNTYTVNSLLNPESDVTAQGAVLSIDGNFYAASDEGNDFADRADSFIKSLLHYYAAGKENTDANASAVLSHVAGGSKASSIINSAKSGLEWVPPNYSITYDVVCSSVCKVADNCYFVDVAYTPLGGNVDNDESASDEDLENEDENKEESVKGSGVYRVYFLDEGSGYRIVLFEGIR